MKPNDLFRLPAVFAACAAFAHAAEPVSFTKQVAPIFAEAACAACHNSDGVASATRLHFPEASAPPERVEAFGRSLVELVDRKNVDESALLRKPTNRTPHAGGERIKPGSREEEVLRGWILQLAALNAEEVAAALRFREEEASGVGQKPLTVVLRRLTHSQYNNTIRDLLGDRSAPASQFAPEDFVNGFKNQYQAQGLSQLQVDAYGAAAERLARNAFRGGDDRGLVGCAPSAACRTQFIRSFGLKAFRRPLDTAEERRYAALFAKETKFFDGARLVVEAMLQSPHFLFRLDETTNPKWKPYAAASRLSFALWDTMPDAALLDAARRGALNSPQAVAAAARRMLDDPRAKQALEEFISQWMRFDRVLSSTKDRQKFRQFGRETLVAMTLEARHFIADLVWNDRDFRTLFTADYGFMNGDLARIYGADPPPEDFLQVKFPADSERAGLLGQALFLSLTSKPDDTSPTSRGLFVREQFLCQHVADPPPGVNTNLPPVTEARPQTNRERLAEHTLNKSCAGCHNLVDPIGFGFEKFDAIGARREKLRITFGSGRGGGGGREAPPPKTTDLDLDTTGWVAGIANSNFRSPKELGAVLANSAQCQECIVKQYFRYLAGRSETPADRPLLRNALEEFRTSGFRFREMIISLVRLREMSGEGGSERASLDHKTR